MEQFTDHFFTSVCHTATYTTRTRDHGSVFRLLRIVARRTGRFPTPTPQPASVMITGHVVLTNGTRRVAGVTASPGLTTTATTDGRGDFRLTVAGPFASLLDTTEQAMSGNYGTGAVALSGDTIALFDSPTSTSAC